MKTEQRVSNLELSKKLRDLNVKQDSFWWWYYSGRTEEWTLGDEFEEQNIANCCDKVSAFSVGELGEMLPANKVRTLKWFSDWYCEVFDDVVEQLNAICRKVAITEANARAKCLIYLLENKLMEIPK